ncbi:hypothetical protein ACFXA3_01745 [Streptomyces sp. NPDC059456]|uniref:hypothetical protein n=1 Tax=Streptomyces sp. NPDC059456 TaxID=3346838 RepID=UPI0036ACB882
MTKTIGNQSQRRARLHRPGDSCSAAIGAAHEVYVAARAAAEAGLEIPYGRPDGWGACGYRAGWELDWPAAKASPWKSPYSWVTRQPFEL